MPPRRSKLPLLAGLLASLLIHAWLLLPGLIAVMHGGELYSMTARFSPEEIRAPEEETTDDQTLGLENGAPSTLTWIGYEEYQEQHAALAKIEQAAFTETPGPPDSPAPSTPPAPPPEPSPDQQPTENTPDTTEPTPESPTPPESPSVPPASPAVPSTFDQVLALLNDMQDAAATPPSETKTPPKKPTPPAPKPEAAKKTEPTPTPITPPTPPAPTKPAGSGIPADPSDRESDASSIVEVPIDQMKIGKPLSAKGLEIKTKRPDFTNLQRLTALPGNPLYEIAFDRTGRPRKVKPLELAGDKGIDAAVQASLYRWRAKGKPLQKLGPKETLKFRIRIMLSRGGRGR